jgi:uncharacterized protein YcaQ
MTHSLTQKELNRATLARQMLLAREKTPVLRAVERLAGLQAQLARPPYVGLWSRVAGFRSEDLTRLARDRKVVRATLMRCTLHLVSTKDYHALRPVLQPMLTAAMHGIVSGTWRIERQRSSAALILQPFVGLSRKARVGLTQEGTALVRFAEPDSRAVEVKVLPLL